MFCASSAHLQEVKDVNCTCMQHLVFSFSAGGRYTVYYIWKLLYMFRVVPPPIIRSAYNWIYSIWYLSHR